MKKVYSKNNLLAEMKYDQEYINYLRNIIEKRYYNIDRKELKIFEINFYLNVLF